MKKVLGFALDFMRRADMFLFALCSVCAIYGMVIISSATASYDGGSLRFMLVQGLAFIIGIGLYCLLTVFDIDIIASRWPLLLVFSSGFLMTTLLWGETTSGGSGGSWLRFGGIGIQPTEVVKFVYIVMMAKHVSYLKAYKNLNSPVSVIQLGLHFAGMFLLVIWTSDDLGSAMVFFFIFVVMLFVAGLKLYWFAAGIAAVAAALPIMWTKFFRQYQRDRILAPYFPSVDPEGTGVRWQANNSRIALASGQFWGRGLYKGAQSQSSAIPEKHTDFIFAVAGEELGMIGCIIIILLLSCIILRCAYIGVKSRNTMNMLICFGMAATIFFQTFENIGMCMGLTPVIGITLPFFSYGGSSLFSMFAAMGIVSGIKYRPKPQRFYVR